MSWFIAALALASQDKSGADEPDLQKLTVARCEFGTPVQPVDLMGKVVVWRTWSG